MSIFSSRTRRATDCAVESTAYAARSAGQDLRDARDEARHTVIGLQKDLARRASQTEGRAKNFVRNMYGEIENSTGYIAGQVRTSPVKAALLMVSAGFLIGALFNKRS